MMNKGFETMAPTPRSSRFGWTKAIAWAVCIGVVIILLTRIKSEQEAQFSLTGIPLPKEWVDGTNDHELQAATAANDYAAVRRRLKSVAPSALKPEMLHRFAYDRRIEILRAFLDSGWNPNGTEGRGQPLIAAITQNQEKAARLLLQRGAKVNVSDERGIPLVALAAFRDLSNSSLLEVLLKRGADPNAGSSAPIADVLRITRADAINSRHRIFPIEVAVRSNRPDVARLLIKYGADVRALDAECPSLVATCVAQENDLEVPGNETIEMLKLLLENGAPLDDTATVVISNPDLSRRAIRGTPLFIAFMRGDAEAAELLLEYGADLDAAYKGTANPQNLPMTHMRAMAR